MVTWCKFSYHCFAELVWSVGATKRTEIPLVVAGFVLCCFGFRTETPSLLPNFSEPELPSVSELCSSCGISLRNSQYLHFVSIFAFCFNICILFQ